MPRIDGRKVFVWVFSDVTESSATPSGLFWEGTAAHAVLLHEHARIGKIAPGKQPLLFIVRESRAEDEYHNIAALLRKHKIPNDDRTVWLFDEFDKDGKRTRGLRVSFVVYLDDENEAAPKQDA